METIYVYTRKSVLKIIQDILLGYNILPLTINEIKSDNFVNCNVILIFEKSLTNLTESSFFSKNNVLILTKGKENFFEITKSENINFLSGQVTIKKFLDEIKTRFLSKKIILNNLEISDSKIINKKTNLSEFLTPIEKDILNVLFKNKEIKRDYLLEKVLGLKKNVETKTIESHFTRIRRKLLKIKSKIQIINKDDVFKLGL